MTTQITTRTQRFTDLPEEWAAQKGRPDEELALYTSGPLVRSWVYAAALLREGAIVKDGRANSFPNGATWLATIPPGR